ncbi:hypothetical protein GALMADRAFT_143390 [Galerina marginata CBS 339.88]|uniref:Uncharacterized protein n=1 Tax=Galerina marginata (strain CBS 339.88) TaxID=685588 RepID=A0A067SZ64_GALM3|nr:hypothetical protein GALMADRAFT_143390 [Galerina marginata CBS 339.88]
MSASTPRFLTSRSDYNNIILFRHIRQSLAAAQTDTVEAFCTVAASKPGTEFHYLGLLWDCAFKAGIASMGAHSKSFTCPPTPVMAPSSPKISALRQPFARDFSVLRSGSKKPFGSLHQRFRRFSQMQKQSATVLAAPIPIENLHPPSNSFLSHDSHPVQVSPQSPLESYESPNPTCAPSPETPIAQECQMPSPPIISVSISESLPRNPPSDFYSSSSITSRSFIRQPSWFRLRSKIPQWIRARSTFHPDDLPTGFSKP